MIVFFCFLGGDERFERAGEDVVHVAFSHSDSCLQFGIGTLSASIVAAAHVVLLRSIDTVVFHFPEGKKKSVQQ